MSRLGHHSRNHSFPPAIRFRQKPSKTLNTPLPDIDDEPWLHFLSSPDYTEEHADYVHFDAGILSATESAKRKAHKFRPTTSKKWSEKPAVHYHHGAFQRREEEHGYVQNRPDPFARIIEYDLMSASHPSDVSRQPRHGGRRSFASHRHSWQEPSVDLFTLDEENSETVFHGIDDDVPSIVVSDFDRGHDTSEPAEDIFLPLGDVEGHIIGQDGAESPRIAASLPSEQPDSDLNQMWLGERARL